MHFALFSMEMTNRAHFILDGGLISMKLHDDAITSDSATCLCITSPCISVLMLYGHSLTQSKCYIFREGYNVGRPFRLRWHFSKIGSCVHSSAGLVYTADGSRVHYLSWKTCFYTAGIFGTTPVESQLSIHCAGDWLVVIPWEHWIKHLSTNTNNINH